MVVKLVSPSLPSRGRVDTRHTRFNVFPLVKGRLGQCEGGFEILGHGVSQYVYEASDVLQFAIGEDKSFRNVVEDQAYSPRVLLDYDIKDMLILVSD